MGGPGSGRASGNADAALKWLGENFDPVKSRCWVCGADGELVVDHCHKTNMIRGLLCRRCNWSLTSEWEDPAWREAAFRYLDGPGTGIPYSGVLSNSHLLKNLGCEFRGKPRMEAVKIIEGRAKEGHNPLSA